jgi:endonuclease/exonuclease/phosphatase family metal-dependent hydrolase
VHPDDEENPVFGRDLLEVEIYNSTRTRRLLTIYNNHLKSHFIPFFEDQEGGAKKANERRKRQAEAIAHIVEARMRPDSRYIVLGDMNDPPDSPSLAPMIHQQPELINALQNPVETRPAKADDPPPATTAWTHRYKPSGQPTQYDLFDQIWLSPSLADKQEGSWIDRRTKHSGDGSDHDPGWIELDV